MIARILTKSLERGELHHAYLLVGDKDEVRKEINDFLSQAVGPDFSSNPDIWWREYANFGINDSHELRGFQTLRAIRGDHKFIIVSLSLATIEAQNALLKTIEEPTPGTHIFLVVESLDRIILTIISRCQLLKQKTIKGEGDLGGAKLFAESEPAERLKLLSAILDIEEAKEVKAEALQFVNKLERYWHDREDNLTDWRIGLDRLESVRKELSWPTATVKALLEHLAVSLPVL